MSSSRFLIIDGYPVEGRRQFDDVGMKLAGVLYGEMLARYLPEAEADIWFVCDSDATAPNSQEIASYDGILWPGCSKTVYRDESEVLAMLQVASDAYETGVPAFGSCWGIQIAAYAAGGTVEVHPDGREMGISRAVEMTDDGLQHPMMAGKPSIYSTFTSHDDHITRLPPGAQTLSGNAWSPIQAAVFHHRNGSFWAVQYHPEYDLHELARLIIAREPKLLKHGFFRSHEDLQAYVDRLEALHREPDRKDLRWQLGIGDDIIDPVIRQLEFANWVRHHFGDER
jgi:GMP synthase (glutamine-hydrolysing)